MEAVPQNVLKVAHEVMRRHQGGAYSAVELRTQLLKLECATALASAQPKRAVMALNDELDRHVGDRHVLEGVTARVMDTMYDKTAQADGGGLEGSLDQLVEVVTESEDDLVAQLSATIHPGERIMVRAEPDGCVIERSILDAAEGFASEGGGDTSPLVSVVVVRVLPDVDGTADRMRTRLSAVRRVDCTVVDDVDITRAMVRCDKVIVHGVAADVDEGIACVNGSALLVGVADRMRVAVVGWVSRFGVMPVGSGCLGAMAGQSRFPGEVWDYDEARDDRKRAAVVIVAPKYDVIASVKFEMVVTELGGYAPEYLVHLMPSFERAAQEEEEEEEEGEAEKVAPSARQEEVERTSGKEDNEGKEETDD